jgi:hypothetical protein
LRENCHKILEIGFESENSRTFQLAYYFRDEAYLAVLHTNIRTKLARGADLIQPGRIYVPIKPFAGEGLR